MSSAGYNGWADAPEEEREGAEPFERDPGQPGVKPPVAETPAAPSVAAPRHRRGNRAA